MSEDTVVAWERVMKRHLLFPDAPSHVVREIAEWAAETERRVEELHAILEGSRKVNVLGYWNPTTLRTDLTVYSVLN